MYVITRILMILYVRRKTVKSHTLSDIIQIIHNLDIGNCKTVCPTSTLWYDVMELWNTMQWWRKNIFHCPDVHSKLCYEIRSLYVFVLPLFWINTAVHCCVEIIFINAFLKISEPVLSGSTVTVEAVSWPVVFSV